MPIFDGTTQIHQMFLGSTQIHVARIGSQAVFPDSLGNAAPTRIVFESSPQNNRNFVTGNQNIIGGTNRFFRATIDDDDFTDGTLELLQGTTVIQTVTTSGAGTRTFVFPTAQNTEAVSRTYTARYTDIAGETITSTAITITWSTLVRFSYSWVGTGGSASAAAQLLAPLVGVGGTGNSGSSSISISGVPAGVTTTLCSNIGVAFSGVRFTMPQCFTGTSASAIFEWVVLNEQSAVTGATSFWSASFPAGFIGTATNARPSSFN